MPKVSGHKACQAWGRGAATNIPQLGGYFELLKTKIACGLVHLIMMPLFSQSLFVLALPILGVATFWSSWIQDFAKSSFPFWSGVAFAPQVRLSQGLVVGTILDSKFPTPIEGFMGLPYAQPPTGDRRFRRALALPESNITFEAKKYGPMYGISSKSFKVKAEDL